jgi:ParB/RepB/Spo0J family partition protein
MTNPIAQTTLIPLAKTDFAPDARKHDPAALEILAHDMKLQEQLQEIIVESKDGRFTVIAGVGRTLAAKKLGWKEIRASVRTRVSDFDKTRITFAENEDREDVDPFYQAHLIQKMLSARKCSHRELGKDLGISNTLVDAYVTVNGLPQQIREMPNRLGITHLIQIARLNKADSKIEFAKNCAKNDLSVRQLKRLVDRAVKKPGAASKRRPAPTTVPDPLAKVWSNLKAWEKMSADIYWEVEYGSHKLDSGNSLKGWYFFVTQPVEGLPTKTDAQKMLARWFGQMMQGLEGKKIKEEIPELIKEMKETESDLMTALAPRLPKTAAEEAELSKLAKTQGPQAVYRWIYGKDHPATQMVPRSWKEMGMTTATGLSAVLEGIRQFGKVEA